MNKNNIGHIKEEQAALYLKNKGYSIIAMNYSCRVGEIDIIAKDKDVYVFVEVKYRTLNKYGDPAEYVNIKKQKKICQAALTYFSYNYLKEDCPCRFDVIAIYPDDTVKHIENAFMFIL